MSRNRSKGTRYENWAVLNFAPLFPYCERRALRGKNDAGDLCGLPVPVEVKCSSAYLADAVKEAKQAAVRVGALGWMAYLHAVGKGREDDYCVTGPRFMAVLLRCWDDAGRPMYEAVEIIGEAS